jgi:two-component system KDP operon response regulator KdpE
VPASGAAKILVVDDEPQIRKFLRIALEAHGFEVVEAARGEEGLAKCATDRPSLAILDLGLPDMEGRELIRRIREWSPVPILVLSVRQAEPEKVAALDAGANDYVVKPFGIAELLARVRVLLRAHAGTGDRDGPTAVIEANGLRLDIPRHEVLVDGAPVKLTRKEFELLRVLVVNAGRLMTHRHLLRELWGEAHQEDTQYLRVFIGQLRAKLGDDPAAPRFIANEPGVGYRFIEGHPPA